jgi:hypothetical protein
MRVKAEIGGADLIFAGKVFRDLQRKYVATRQP